MLSPSFFGSEVQVEHNSFVLCFGSLKAKMMHSLVAQTVKNLPAMWETWFDPWVRKIPWKSKWHRTPVLLPGKFHGQRSLEGYSLWGCKESDMT